MLCTRNRTKPGALTLLLVLGWAGPGLAQAPRRLLATELGVGTSIGGAGYSTSASRFGDVVSGKSLMGRVVFGGYTVEAQARLQTPWRLDVSGAAGILELRLGWTAETWSVVAGVVAQHGFFAEPPLQFVPAARARLKLGEVTLSAGLFDYLGFAPASLSVERGDFGVGYLAPLGVETHLRLRVREYIGVTLQAMALRIGRAEMVMATLTINAGYAAGTPPTDRAPVPAVLDDRL